MRTLLRHLLDEREWHDYDVFLPRFQQAARELAEREGPDSLVRLEPAKRTFQGWYYGDRRPNVDARRVLVHLLGHTIRQLWTPAPEDGGAQEALSQFDTAAAHAESGVELNEMRRTGAMAARRAMDFAMGAERGQVGEDTLGFLGDEVGRLAEAYPKAPLSEIWDDLAQSQEEAFRLLDSGRARPSQSRDLLFMASALSFMMAKGSHDIGDPKAAMIQARTASFCARQAEHTGLMAMADGLKSLISYWAGRPQDALHYAQQGTAVAEVLRGTVSPWLHGLQARAAALLGDHETVRAANERALTLREQVVPDELDELGGLFTYPEIKQRYYSVEAAVLLGQGDASVARAAEEAADGFSDPSDPNWAFGDQAGAQCNLALVRLYGDDLDGAAEAVRPVLDLAPTHRNNGIVVSADRVRAALTRSPACDAVVAQDLRAEIEMYRPLRSALPS
ncbi:hypothetical protein [Streptomyces cavernicola]|uniref:XRE family transcriptional regulator n=1 Tax=Streptomyces cavernicola TaxID=3043613 RepID=A0ABT6SHI2_9ACTN|nr:hypothetical protein [Streptomyces sp. B-S-A6]MDI3407657.1 hypothetical protein [Streptomyces sp. B-S-A6]